MILLFQLHQLVVIYRTWLLQSHPIYLFLLAAQLVPVSTCYEIRRLHSYSYYSYEMYLYLHVKYMKPGKTTLVEHIAALTGRTIHNQGLLKVQLGDQTDAKVLLGTYHSTDIPGEFMWTAGVLTRVKTQRFN